MAQGSLRLWGSGQLPWTRKGRKVRQSWLPPHSLAEVLYWRLLDAWGTGGTWEERDVHDPRETQPGTQRVCASEQ